MNEDLQTELRNLKYDIQALSSKMDEILAILKPKPKPVIGRLKVGAKSVNPIHDSNYYQDFEMQKGSIADTGIWRKKQPS